jgi:hypothetical protein
MATVVPSAWAVVSAKEYLVAQCTVTTDASQEVLFTLKTPKELDTSKPYTLIVDADADQDGAAAPIAIYVGYDDTFALAGTTARCTVTKGCIYGEITDDLGYAAAASVAFWMNPGLSVANVVTIAAVATGMKFLSPTAPYHAFEMYAADGATLEVFTATFTIIQK